MWNMRIGREFPPDDIVIQDENLSYDNKDEEARIERNFLSDSHKRIQILC
jgi:hypothetical protein